MEVSGQLHAPGKEPTARTGQEGPITNEQNNLLLLSGIELRFVGRPDRSLVPMLSYSGSH
jgi:hypothetical protein